MLIIMIIEPMLVALAAFVELCACLCFGLGTVIGRSVTDNRRKGLDNVVGYGSGGSREVLNIPPTHPSRVRGVLKVRTVSFPLKWSLFLGAVRRRREHRGRGGCGQRRPACSGDGR